MRLISIMCAVAIGFATPAAPAIAQSAGWPVGTHARVYFALPGGKGMAWRTGVVTEAFPWGVHFHFDDEDRIETFSNDNLKPLGDAPVAPSRSATPVAHGNASAGAAATNGKGDYRVGYGAGVRFGARPAGTAPARRLVSNAYNCTIFIGTPPNGHMARTPGFTIAGSSYRHQDGTTGTVAMSGETLVFHGGSLDGQAASYDAGATGRGTVHIYNASRSRTVIDCDGG